MNETMPKCPKCNDSELVEDSYFPNDGSYYCANCDVWFTPPAITVPPTEPKPLPAEPVQYETLSPRFLELMEEIGQYGLSKYGERSTASRFAKGDYSRDERTKSRAFAEHAANHFSEYIDGVKHDKFNTREHQLAAAAFNAMLEYQFYKETL